MEENRCGRYGPHTSLKGGKRSEYQNEKGHFIRVHEAANWWPRNLHTNWAKHGNGQEGFSTEVALAARTLLLVTSITFRLKHF